MQTKLNGKIKMIEEQISPDHNSTYKKLAVQCSADTFVVNQTLVLRMNICGENRHLRQARNRHATFELIDTEI